MEKMETKRLHDDFSLHRYEVKIQIVGSKASIEGFLASLSLLGEFTSKGGWMEAVKEDRGSFIRCGTFTYEANLNGKGKGDMPNG